jgi:hypothetical protein
MAFESSLPAGAIVIDDSNWRDHVKPVSGPDGESESGYIPRDYGAEPIASGYAAKKMPRELIIPRSEWRGMIEERERTGKRLVDRLTKSGIFILNQSPSWYCWCYSTVNGVMAALISQNETPRLLSPESVAGPIMNYRKQGGWCSKALAYIAEHGVADANAWPWKSHVQANNRKYFAESRENAALTKVTEWWDLETWEEKASCLLRGITVPSCYSYQGHATNSVELIYRDGDFGIIDNDSYSQNGKFHAYVRMGRRAFSDDTVAIRSVSSNQLPATAA